MNGYSLFFEISENQQMSNFLDSMTSSRFHVIYQSRRKDCDDFVVTINERYEFVRVLIVV